MVCYMDSSVLLAILLDEKRRTEARELWNGAEVRVSSLLLKLETITVLRRTFEHNKVRLEPTWLSRKVRELEEYFQEANFRIVDEAIGTIVFQKRELATCRTLDAIHLATALEMRELMPTEDVVVYTFDANMARLARSLKFKTNAADGDYL